MRVVTQLDEMGVDGPVLLTIGTFDGVHRGHRFLLEQAQRRAVEHGYRFAIVTFDPPPAVVLRPDVGRYQLTSAARKVRLLGALDPALVVMLPFTRELARLSAEDFMAAIEARVGLREIWLGEDFHFGRGAQGNLTTLLERGRATGFSLHVVARRLEDATSISSTRIRQTLATGDVAGAMPLLGRPFALDLELGRAATEGGSLASGRFAVGEHLALPADGAYAALYSAAGGNWLPVAARIERGAERQVAIWPLDRIAAQADLELVARLGDDAIVGEGRLARLARDRVERWERPIYPAAGDY